MKNRTLAALFASALALTLTGCGKDDGKAPIPGFFSDGDTSAASSAYSAAPGSSGSIALSGTSGTSAAAPPQENEPELPPPENNPPDGAAPPEEVIPSESQNIKFSIQIINDDKVKIFLKTPDVRLLRYADDNSTIANNITVSFQTDTEEISRCAVHARGINATFIRSEHAILEDYSGTNFPDDTVCWTLEYPGVTAELRRSNYVSVVYSDFLTANGSYKILEGMGPGIVDTFIADGGNTGNTGNTGNSGNTGSASLVTYVRFDEDTGSNKNLTVNYLPNGKVTIEMEMFASVVAYAKYDSIDEVGTFTRVDAFDLGGNEEIYTNEYLGDAGFTISDESVSIVWKDTGLTELYYRID